MKLEERVAAAVRQDIRESQGHQKWAPNLIVEGPQVALIDSLPDSSIKLQQPALLLHHSTQQALADSLPKQSLPL